jgi:hypothetical protein
MGKPFSPLQISWSDYPFVSLEVFMLESAYIYKYVRNKGTSNSVV